MSVDISAQVTATWPTTEGLLTASETIEYNTQKTLAIARAKRDLYGTVTVPAEASIPELAAYWIADRTIVLLIPVARDFYMQQRLSDAKENASINYYNKVAQLDKLKAELMASLQSSKQDVLDAISSPKDADDDAPAVSAAGLMVDAVNNAYYRGAPGGNPDWAYAPD
jgi:hypothetical protein